MPCGSLVWPPTDHTSFKESTTLLLSGQKEWANLNENVNYHHWWWHNITPKLRSWDHECIRGWGGGRYERRSMREENCWLWYFSIILVVMSRKLVHHSTYFSLFYCFTDINDCIGVSCSGNGNCSDRVDGYICFCNSGFFGINCEVGKASHLIQ